MRPYALAGDMVATQDGDSLRLMQQPCPPAVLRHLPEGTRGYFRKALAMVGGREYVGCFAVRVDGLVLVVYEDGDSGLVPVVRFTMEPDA